MRISDCFDEHSTTFSFEFFPPRSAAAWSELFDEIAAFAALRPQFVSVTYGAGGGTREMTHDLVVRIKREAGLEPVPHLTCVCHSESEIGAILERYWGAGIGNIMALGGDPPSNMPGYDRSKDDFRYATDLVKFIRREGERLGVHGGRGFGIGVAGFPEGHPGTPNRLEEMDHLKAKVDAGADYVCTQLFFENRDFYDFRDRCRLAGIRVPIIAGIMPITSLAGMKRMAELAAGARYPATLLRAINRTGGRDEAVRRVGVHWATEQARDLLDHDVQGVHIYSLNKSTAAREIYLNLGVTDSLGLTTGSDPVIGGGK